MSFRTQLGTGDLGHEGYRVLIRGVCRVCLPDRAVSKLHRRRQRPGERDPLGNTSRAQESQLNLLGLGAGVDSVHAHLPNWPTPLHVGV